MTRRRDPLDHDPAVMIEAGADAVAYAAQPHRRC